MGHEQLEEVEWNGCHPTHVFENILSDQWKVCKLCGCMEFGAKSKQTCTKKMPKMVLREAP